MPELAFPCGAVRCRAVPCGNLVGDVAEHGRGHRREAGWQQRRGKPALGPRPPGSSCPTIVTTTCGPHQFDQSNRLLPWLTPSCAMAGAPSIPKGRPCGPTRLGRRMWPLSRAPSVRTVSHGRAITTVVFLALCHEPDPLIRRLNSVRTSGWALKRRAVYAGDEHVGFVMIADGVTVDDPTYVGPYYLWRLLVDRQFQRRGYGTAALNLVAEHVRPAPTPACSSPPASSDRRHRSPSTCTAASGTPATYTRASPSSNLSSTPA